MTGKYAVLLVDDEVAVLEGLRHHLRSSYQVLTATSGNEALELLRTRGPVAVVVSDMRMPEMDGATLLSHVRENWPETVRMLLTGYTDIDTAVAAINQGQIFRFLSKPCPPPLVLRALDAAAEQYRLIHAERELLEQTLRGSVEALIAILALANPAAFGRAQRLRRLVKELGASLGVEEKWAAEIAAMVSQLGAITLPQPVIEKLYDGGALDDTERQMVKKAARIPEQLLSEIPRLDRVRSILRYVANGALQPSSGPVPSPTARIVELALDWDDGLMRHEDPQRNLERLRTSSRRYEKALLEALAGTVLNEVASPQTRQIRLEELRPGMIFAADVRAGNGALLIARGHVATEGVIGRLQNLRYTLGFDGPIEVVTLPADARA